MAYNTQHTYDDLTVRVAYSLVYTSSVQIFISMFACRFVLKVSFEILSHLIHNTAPNAYAANPMVGRRSFIRVWWVSCWWMFVHHAIRCFCSCCCCGGLGVVFLIAPEVVGPFIRTTKNINTNITTQYIV